MRIDVDATRRPLEALLAGKIDIALIARDVPDRRVSLTALFEDEMVLIAAKRHRFAQQTHVKLSEIRDETF